MPAARIVKPIQDAGWSWVIAAACCWVTFVIQGLVRSSGVIYVALIDTFEVTRGQASWPFTLRIAVWNLSGPLAGALSYRWSIRTITFTGILIVTAGYVVCFMASDITIVTIFFGVVQGFGVGISVTLVPVIINQYFAKYKSTGAGIACAGATAGSFALSPIVELTIVEYGLRGAFLMMGGMTLQGVLGAALMRPAEWLKNTPKSLPEKNSKVKQYDDTSQRNTAPSPESKPFLRREQSVSLTLFSSQKNLHVHDNDFGDCALQAKSKNDHEDVTKKRSDNGSLKNVFQNENSSPQNGYISHFQDTAEPEKEELISETSTLICATEGLGSPKPIVIKTTTTPTWIAETHLSSSDIPNGMDSLCHQDDDVPIKGGRLRFTIEDSNYNPKINITPLEKQHNCDNIDSLKEKRCDQHSSNDVRHRCGKYAHPDSIISRDDSMALEKCPSKWRSKFGGLLEPVKAASSIVTNPIFLLIAFSYSVFFLSYMTYLIVIVDYALDLGISRTDSVFLVSTFSIADLCGRLGSGWITDSGFIKRKNLLMTNMTIVGSLLISTSLAESYMALMALSVTTGLVVGVNLIIFYALLEEYLGLQKMAMAVGLMNFCIGCLSVVTPFLTGAFRDTLGTYTYLFHFLGAISIFCGFLWALESILSCCRRKPSMTPAQDDFPQDLY